MKMRKLAELIPSSDKGLGSLRCGELWREPKGGVVQSLSLRMSLLISA